MPRGLLGTNATLVADLNLIVQVTVLVLLAYATARSWHRGLDTQRVIITIAVLINAVLIISVMNPSFFRILPFALRRPVGRIPVFLWPHVVVGLSAELVGVLWLLSSSLNGGMRRDSWSKALRVMVLLWAVAFAIGVVVYLRLYA